MRAQYITREELEAELQKLGVGSSDDDHTLKSSREWAELWGCSQGHVTQLLHHAKRLDLLTVGTKTIIRLDDKPQKIGAYGFKMESVKAKKAKR